MARFIATAVGYDNLAVRQPGDEFDMPDGSTASWFKPAADDTKGPKGKKPKAGAPEGTPEVTPEGDPIA